MSSESSVKRLQFFFDPVSPYAALAFARLPEALAGLSYVVEYRPVLFAAFLQALGQKGPAEIAVKRAWTYRQVSWLAYQAGVALDLPARHPFNPLPLLRLAMAAQQPGGTPSRYVVEQLFDFVWRSGGADATDAQRLQALAEQLKPVRDPSSEAVKQELRDATEQALSLGVFGVPTIEVDGRLFWGQDALPMLAAYLKGDPWFASGAWEAAGANRPATQRRH